MSASSCVWIGSFFSVADRTWPTSSFSGKKISIVVDVLLLRHRDDARLERLVGLEDDLAGRRVDDVGGGEGAFELGVGDLDRLDVGLLQRVDRVLA